MLNETLSPGRYFAQAVDWMNRNWGEAFRAFSNGVDFTVEGMEALLLAPSAALVIALVAFAAWRLSGFGLALFTIAGLVFCWFGDLWEATMLTTALVVVSVSLALLVAIPMGVLAASNKTVERVAKPVLDLMQTMPPWVYLIPAVILLSVGRAPAVMATVIFGIPPALRLTVLGLGLRAGIAVVILSIILDRLSQGLVKGKRD